MDTSFTQLGLSVELPESTSTLALQPNPRLCPTHEHLSPRPKTQPQTPTDPTGVALRHLWGLHRFKFAMLIAVFLQERPNLKSFLCARPVLCPESEL